MDASERRREFLVQMSPWVGFMAATVGIVLGLRAIAAGYVANEPLGYLLGALELLVGYVAGRQGWDKDPDQLFAVAIVAVIVLSVVSVLLLDLPPTVFEQATS